MPNCHISVYGTVIVGNVYSPDKSRPNARIAACEATLPGSADPALVDIHYWGESVPEGAVALVIGEMHCPVDAEMTIFAENFVNHGRYSDMRIESTPALGVLAIGIVKGVSENDTTLETDVYHRTTRARVPYDVIVRRSEGSLARFQNTRNPSEGSLILTRGTLSHFEGGLAVILLDTLCFFSLTNANRAPKTVNTPGNAKRKSELSGNAGPSAPPLKKAKVDGSSDGDKPIESATKASDPSPSTTRPPADNPSPSTSRAPANSGPAAGTRRSRA